MPDPPFPGLFSCAAGALRLKCHLPAATEGSRAELRSQG